MAKQSSSKQAVAKVAIVEPQQNRYHIDAIQRGLDVLWLFKDGRYQLTLAEISRTTGAVPSTTLRIVETLKDMGAIEEIGDSGLYRPGPAVLRLGSNFILTCELREIARPCLLRLSETVGEPIALAIKQDDEVFFVDCIGGNSPMSFHLQIGAAVPAHLSAAGRVILALSGQNPSKLSAQESVDSRILAQARQLGYATQDGEVTSGLRSIAAPIFDENGRAFAAVVIAVGMSQYDASELTRDMAPLLVGTAAEISTRFRAQRAAANRPEAPVIPPQGYPKSNSRYHVEALAKSFQVFECFSAASPRLLLTEISKATKINTSTVFRIASTLKSVGLLDEDSTGRYQLAPKVITLGYRALLSLDLKEFLEPPMTDLHIRSGESVYLSILVGTEAFDIASFRKPGMVSTTGRSYPLYCTPGGKIWLAFMPGEAASRILDSIQLVPRAARTITDRATIESELERIRTERLCEVYEEYLPGVSGVAAPILDSSERCVASVAVSFSSVIRENQKRRLEMIKLVKSAAEDMSTRLRWRFT